MTYPLEDSFARSLQPRNGLDASLNSTPSNWAFVPMELAYTTDTNQLSVFDSNGKNPAPVGGPRVVLTNLTTQTTANIPAGYVIDDVFIQEMAGNTVTGGIKIGTTSGGTQIVASITVSSGSFTRTLPGGLTTSGPFSATLTTTIFIQAVTGWNSANLTIVMPMKRAIV